MNLEQLKEKIGEIEKMFKEIATTINKAYLREQSYDFSLKNKIEYTEPEIFSLEWDEFHIYCDWENLEYVWNVLDEESIDLRFVNDDFFEGCKQRLITESKNTKKN